MKATVVFNAKYEMFDGVFGSRIVSRAKTERAVVRTLIKKYGAENVECDPGILDSVSKAKDEFLTKTS